ncbi:MAG: M14 family zinc carboxypeptidase, partial [Candidatus Aminicenantes bacterium]|nr:M14 family zinc carboxypeptidase [Candidatus Aminicenantes bacterium]
MNMQKKGILPIFSILLLTVSVVLPLKGAATTSELKFDHNHTYGEVVVYLQGVIESFPKLAKLHNIGKSYLGKDLLVLEITNHP